jgi:hypothetical protein
MRQGKDQGRIVVIGNAALDVAYRLPAFPRPGETLIADSVTQDIGGKGRSGGMRPRGVSGGCLSPRGSIRAG